MAQCRVCWDGAGEDDMYELPCKCKGSVGIVHMSCFVSTMLHRVQVGQGSTCDVCHARIPTPTPVDALHYQCLCYNASFVILLYLLFATTCCVWWVQDFDTLSTEERRRSVIQFSAVIVCLQPMLWVCTYMFISLHLMLHTESMQTDSAAVYTDYLSTYGKLVHTV